jgi:hypothetical protein
MNPPAPLLASPDTLLPVTPEQAGRNYALLEAELIAYEIEHGHHMHGKPKAAARRRVWGAA